MCCGRLTVIGALLMVHVAGCGRAENNHENDTRGGASGIAGASGTGAQAGQSSGGSTAPDQGGATSMSGGATSMSGGATPMSGGATPMSGGATSMSGGATSMSGGASGGTPTENEAGTSGSGPHTTDPLVLCGNRFLFYCSKEAVCATLGCGKPWSNFDADGCYRKDCSFGRTCDEGMRCVPAVLTDFTQSCFADVDICDDASGTCTCDTFGCYPKEVCVGANEFPPGAECNLEGLLCGDLQLALENIDAYIQSQFAEESGPMSKQAKAMVDACRARVIDSIFTLCP